MSKVLINQYYTNIQRAIQYGKSRNEKAIRTHTQNLINAYAHKKNYELIPEISCLGTKGKKVYPDGVLRNNWGLDIGYWESKDEKDNIQDEIDAKIRKGYPLTNILFEDSQTAVLYQYGQEVMRVPVIDPEKLDLLLDRFIEYKNETVYRFEKALENFKVDIPVIIEALRDRIEQTGDANPEYLQARDVFLKLCKTVINPEITLADIREMMIQHLLTSDIFNKIFDEPEFHRHNSVARELENLIGTLFSYGERRNLLNSVEHFYEAINATAASITDHHEKQKFLKVLYENFYKVYNPKAADRLGVVYTPNEIVQFMIHGTDYLLEKHFGKTLADPGVEILDPAVGTGTFICDIIEHIPEQHLVSKYKNELHANEVAILPYYIANLNIEYAFKQKMGYFEEFPNICFVDTLDNTEGLSYKGQQHSLFGLSSENAERINRQNQKKISVIIGNPPYNANQKNENENNKNREYPFIDKRIKDTYVKLSTAQKTKAYDMYSRFYRWASDRIEHDGVICLITNNSYINGRTFDGFRKCIEHEFDYAYFIDLGGNIRELSGKDGIWMNEEHTIFGVAAAVGISIGFLIKKSSKNKKPCELFYIHPCDIRATRIDKFEWLKSNSFEKIEFNRIIPDKNHNWINVADTDFESLLPLIGNNENSIFSKYYMGVVTNRDEWNYDHDKETLENKMNFFINAYADLLQKGNNEFPPIIKWSDTLKKNFNSKKGIVFDRNKVIKAFYKPFTYRWFYSEKVINDRLTANHYEAFGTGLSKTNYCFGIIGKDTVVPFTVSSFNVINDLNSLSNAAGGNKTFSFFRYDQNGNRIDNMTNWGLEQFQNHYPGENFTKEDIFHYVYAVLHNPAYREKYELNLKREFPRIPFYDDFRKWSEWGKKLMELHINFETVEPYDLEVVEKQIERSPAEVQKEIFSEAAEPDLMFSYQPRIKAKLKAIKEDGIIEIDELTTLKGIPSVAWEYKLGNRSALEWVLDQYKEKKPSDPTIAEKFNTYRFSDYKEHVIDLLKRVCTVSVETMAVVGEMHDARN